MTKHVNVEAKECASVGVCALNSEHEVTLSEPGTWFMSDKQGVESRAHQETCVLPRNNY